MVGQYPILRTSQILTMIRYYPVLMVAAGLATYVWDVRWLHNGVNAIKDLAKKMTKRCRRRPPADAEKSPPPAYSKSRAESYLARKPLPKIPSIYSMTPKSFSLYKDSTFEDSSEKSQCWDDTTPYSSRRTTPASLKFSKRSTFSSHSTTDLPTHKEDPNDISGDIPAISWQMGACILVMFTLTFVLFITMHILLTKLSRVFELFSSLYLAGTIIFGGMQIFGTLSPPHKAFADIQLGGPVVIPLLRSYIVTPGWVSPRDFLLGIAVIQAFPGPNFNFVVYLGALSVTPSYVGALVAFVAMYTPGLFIVVGFMGLWRRVSNKMWFISTLRGVNAAAVGLVFTAVYKLYMIGYLKEGTEGGSSLGEDPWLVLISASAYAGGQWWGVEAPIAILAGGVLGVGRWGVIHAATSS